jgi:alpha-L-fucosidase
MIHFGDGRDWFFQRRFGLFIHWGIYAVDAWHEQDIFRRRRTREDYDRSMRRFNPRRFDPDAWLDLAEEAGMRYLCFTTKHIDGFCMWDSAHTTYSVTHTPYGKDILAMLAEACHRRDVPLCLYHSIVDMHHPNYPNAGRSYEFPGPQAGDEPDLGRYLAYLKAQVRELCTRYGKIHGFWWDGNVLEHRDPSINAMIRELQPGIIINNRGMDDGDFGTPERDWDESVRTERRFEKPIEACQALGRQSWGHRRGEDYYTDKHLLRGIANILAKGGNYLLNTGPKADGTIAREDARLLRAIGRWHRIAREALYDTEPCSSLTENRDVLLTRRGNTFYVILHREPATRAVELIPFTLRPRSAVLLNTGRPVKSTTDMLPWQFRHQRGYLCLHGLPLSVLNTTVPVIRLDFDGDPVSSDAC